MLISLGAQEYVLPAPVFLVGTFDSAGQANIMAAVSVSAVSMYPPRMAVAVRPGTWTYKAMLERRALTLNLPGKNLAAQVDYAGLISGEKEDKFKILGLTARPGEHVDAPYVLECPVVMELTVDRMLELGTHTLFICEVLDTRFEESVLDLNQLPDPKKIDPLCYSPMSCEYYSLGDFVARAYAVGKTVSRLQ